MNAWIALAVVFAGGLALGLQPPVNSALSRHVGDSIAATMISFGVGFVALFAMVVFRNALPGLAVLRTLQPWMLLGGAFGAFYVWSALWGVSRLGVLTLIAALVAGQLLAALAIDHFGAFNLEAREISWQRVVAVLLVGAGLVMSRL